MPNVNLIAARREEKKKLERVTRQLFFGMALSAAAFILIGMFLAARRWELDAEMAAATERMQKLQPTIDRIKQIEAQTAVLQPKVDTLTKAKTETLRWRSLFTVISEAIPNQAWIQSLASNGGAGGQITLVGVASSQSVVGDTMTRLGSHPIFDKIDLDHTQATGVRPDGTVQKVSFQIVAHVRAATPPPAKGAAVGAAAPGTKTASAADREGNSNGSAS